jgi:group II intron reverse transcriptase/maturase
MGETSGSQTVSTKLERIATLAKQAPEMAFTTLAHHMDVDWLREAYRRTRKNGAPGVDGVTAEQYAANLQSNLQDLLGRAKDGSYRAPPVRRVYIPKQDGSKRPLGLPTFEDKVLQRAVAMLLEPVYEQDFLDCSYGFRPGRSARDALKALRGTLMQMHGGWVLEVDLAKFYDSLDHEHLRRVLGRRVRDGVVTRLIGKWLNAGVLEDGGITRPEQGTPQGGVISPLLANVFLHDVIDTWFERDVKPRMRGRAVLVRYADDIAMVFSNEQDARRVLEVLPKRLEKFGLKLHPDKTRLVAFQRPGPGDHDDPNNSGASPGSFEMLGFVHRWERSRSGYWVVMLRTAPKRLQAALQRIREWCRLKMHAPVREQWGELSQKLRGHYGYYGVEGNSRALSYFAFQVYAAWRWSLNRRSQRARVTWDRMKQLSSHYPLPPPRIQWSAR